MISSVLLVLRHLTSKRIHESIASHTVEKQEPSMLTMYCLEKKFWQNFQENANYSTFSSSNPFTRPRWKWFCTLENRLSINCSRYDDNSFDIWDMRVQVAFKNRCWVYDNSERLLAKSDIHSGLSKRWTFVHKSQFASQQRKSTASLRCLVSTRPHSGSSPKQQCMN